MARRRDLRWLAEGTYLIVRRPKSLGEVPELIAYSMDYGRIWRYWMFNPEGLPDHEGWMIAQRRNGANVILKKPIPPDRLKRLARQNQATA